jgi:Rod binding domain-containing protein
MVAGTGWRDFAGTSATAPAKAESVREAAAKFEALLIAQMLKAAREAGDGSGDEGDSTMREVAEECLAQTLASQGGLGLGRLIEGQLLSPESRGDS